MGRVFLSSIIVTILLISIPNVASSVGETISTEDILSVTAESQKELLEELPLETTPLDVEPKEIIDIYTVYDVTAYTSGYESTQKKKGHPLYGVTASGEKVMEGVTAACPKSLELGTKIYIKELDHTYECKDRGGAITEGHLDIYFDNLKIAKEFGRQKLNVKVTKMED